MQCLFIPLGCYFHQIFLVQTVHKHSTTERKSEFFLRNWISIDIAISYVIVSFIGAIRYLLKKTDTAVALKVDIHCVQKFHILALAVLGDCILNKCIEFLICCIWSS